MSQTWCCIGLLFALSAVGLEACGGTEPQFTGFITSIERVAGTGEARITVESDAHKMVERHVVVVTAKTVIVRQQNQAETTVTQDSLAVKNWVKIWFASGEKKPHAHEGTARRIMIVERP